MDNIGFCNKYSFGWRAEHESQKGLGLREYGQKGIGESKYRQSFQENH